MKEKYTLTTELKRIFTHIKKELIKEYPNNKIKIEYFLVSFLQDESSIAYQIVEKLTLNETIDTLQDTIIVDLCGHTCPQQLIQQPLFDDVYDEYITNVTKVNKKVDSGLLLIEILKNNTNINKTFRNNGISREQLEKCYNEQFPQQAEDATTKSKKLSRNKQITENGKLLSPISYKEMNFINNDVEKYLVNISKLSHIEQIDPVIGNEEVYDKIFRILTKKKKNNVVIVGDSGVGKSCIIENIANKIRDNNVPLQLKNKMLMKMNFSDLLVGTGIRGVLETKIKSIVNDAKKSGNYIIFLDDINSLFDQQKNMGDIDIPTILDNFLSEPNIMFICATNHKSYNKDICKHNLLKRRLIKVEINEQTPELIKEIVNNKRFSLEKYHNVEFTEEAIENSISLSQRYITNVAMPDSVIDVLDESAALVNNQRTENNKIITLKASLEQVIEEKTKINLNTTNNGDIDLYNELLKKEMSLIREINTLEKQDNAKKITLTVNGEIIKRVISDRIGVPITDIVDSDKEKLKNLKEKLQRVVIGQDEAIDNVCRVVKRQRIGISDPTKPPVLLFAGSTGTGKTFLAKQLSKELFGDENHLVRLDMSEYIDKTSTNKLIGAGSGYIGYENGGVLTEAIKKHKHCVLLLDEIEKANEDVHNVFLQLFDEGRLTDNAGDIVDFRHCIIIMTSNVGAQEADERGNGIGFNQSPSFSNEIINKTLKKTFKPEFINRINSIVYFNKLNDNNLKTIIKNEINKIVTRIQALGFEVDETITNTDLPSLLFNRIQTMRQYGARPIVRELQKILEDSVTDYIIDNNPPRGFIFSYQNLCF